MDNTNRLKFSIVILLIAFAVILIFFTISDNIVDVAKSMVDANVALIGFVAVVLVFLLTSLEGRIKQSKEDIEKLDLTHSEYIKQFGKDEKEFSEHIKKSKKMHYKLGYTMGFSDRTLKTGVTSVVCFISAIFFAFLSMGGTLINKYIGFYGSASCVIIGLAFLITLLYDYKDLLFEQDTCISYDKK